MVQFKIDVVVSPTQARRGIASVRKDLQSLERQAMKTRTTIRAAFQIPTTALRSGTAAVRQQFREIQAAANRTRRVVRGAVSIDTQKVRRDSRVVRTELTQISRTASGVRRNIRNAVTINTAQSQRGIASFQRGLQRLGAQAVRTGRTLRSSIVIDPVGVRRGAAAVRAEMVSIETLGTRVRRSLVATFGLIGVTVGAASIVSLADAYTQLQNRLRSVIPAQQDLGVVTQQVLDIATRTRSALDSTTEVYARTALAAKELGRSQGELLQFTESLNQAVILSGAGAQEARNALIQLSQGIASGALRGDELRSVLEQLPVVADVIAKELGVTRGELRALGAEGEISANIVLDAFKAAREELSGRFAKTVPTIGQSFVVLRTELVRFFGSVDEVTGVTGTFAQAILSLSENLDAAATIVAALTISFGAKGLAGAILKAVQSGRALSLLLSTGPWVALAGVVAFVIDWLKDLFTQSEETAEGLGLIASNVTNTKEALEDLSALRGDILDARKVGDAEALVAGLKSELESLKQFAEGEFASLDISPRALQRIVPSFDAEEFSKLFPTDFLIPAEQVQAEIQKLVQTIEAEIAGIDADGAAREAVNKGREAIQGLVFDLNQQQFIAGQSAQKGRILELQFRALSEAIKSGAGINEDLVKSFADIEKGVKDLDAAVGRSELKAFLEELKQSNSDLTRQQLALQEGGERMLASELAVIEARAIARRQGIKLSFEQQKQISEEAAANFDLLASIDALRDSQKEGPAARTTERDSFESVLAGLRKEADLLRLLNDARERKVELQRIEDQLLKEGTALSDGQRMQLEGVLRANQALADQAEIVEQILGPQRQLEVAQAALSAAYRAGTISLEQYENALLDFQITALESSTSAAAGAERAFLRIQQAAADHAAQVESTILTAYDAATDAIADFALSGFQDLQSLQAAAAQIFAQIAADLAKLAVQQGLAELFPSKTPTADGGGDTTASTIGLITTLLSLFGGAADGTLNAQAGKPIVVGERGPELFRPRTSGSIIPSERMAEMFANTGSSDRSGAPSVNVAPPAVTVVLQQSPNESFIQTRVERYMDSSRGQKKLVENIGKNKRQVKEVTS